MSAEPTGFRRDINMLHHLSELMEKNPALRRPDVTLHQGYMGANENQVAWFLAEDYGAPQGEHKTRGDARRAELEERIAALVLLLEESDDNVEWEKNDPTEDYGRFYYRLTATWHGAQVTISTMRSAVCEEVVVLETDRFEEQPDPEVVEKLMAAAPKVKVKVTDKITEWQCNERLAAVTAPKHVRTVQVVS